MGDAFRQAGDILRHLDGLGLFHVELGLSRMQRALAALDLARPPFLVAQVLGTNGKGSTSAFLAELARAHGLAVGLYTSPHFVSPEERIRLGGPGRPLAPWPLRQWLSAANALMAAAPDLTYFEFLTVLALLAFRDARVDLAVLEAGLGGRHDATTAVAADALCFTPVALDHKEVLGATLGAIAADKAGAVRSTAPVFSVPQFPDAAAALEKAARAHGASLTWAAPAAHGLPLGLSGPHQRSNAGLALAAWRELAPRLGKSPDNAGAQAQALAAAFLPGRLQAIPATADTPPLLLDGAHNPHGMAALTAHLEASGLHPAGAVYACLGDKDWRPALRRLKAGLGGAPLLVVQLTNSRAADAAAVAAYADSLPPAGARVVPAGRATLARALRLALDLPGLGPQHPVLLTGSLYLLAEFFALYPRWLSPAAP